MAPTPLPPQARAAGSWVPVSGNLFQHAPLGRDAEIGRMLLSFEPAYRDDLVFLFRLMRRLNALLRRTPRTADEAYACDVLRTPPARGRWRRWQIPAPLTEGVPVLLCEARLEYRLLPEGMTFDEPGRDMMMLPLRADPRPGGRTEMLPYTRRDMEALQDRFVDCVARRGVRVNAALVQANPDLYRAGRRPKPALVLLTFETGLPRPEAYLLDLARRAFALKDRPPRNRDEDDVLAMLRASDRSGVMYRRWQLPPSFTGGPAVYAADVLVPPRYLRHGYLTERILPCVAEPGPGPEAALELLPYWDQRGALPAAQVLPVVPLEGPAPTGAADALPEVVLLDEPEPLPAWEVAPAAPTRAVTPVAEVVDDELPSPAPPRRGVLPAVLFGLAGVLLLAAGGLLVWWLTRSAGRGPVRLSNPRREVVLGPRTNLAVDYEAEVEALARGGRHFLVIRWTGTGVTTTTPVVLPAGQARGTLRAGIVTLPGPFGARAGPLELHVEAEFPDRPGRRERVSNAVILP